MADTHDKDEHGKRGLFQGRRRSEGLSTGTASSSSQLREERKLAVEAYYGVYPEDAAERDLAKAALREPPHTPLTSVA